MSYEYSEDNLVEAAAQKALEDLGWQVEYVWTKETFGNELDIQVYLLQQFIL